MTSLILAGDKDPIFSTRSVLFIVIICDMFTTLSFLKPPSPFLRSTLPGASALFRLEVRMHTAVVLILLWLKRLFCMMKRDDGFFGHYESE